MSTATNSSEEPTDTGTKAALGLGTGVLWATQIAHFWHHSRVSL